MTGAISSRRRRFATAARCNNPGRIVVRLLITGLESRDVEASLMRSSADHAQLARPPDTLSANPSSATLLPTLAEFGEGIQPQLVSFSAGELNITKADDALPREINSLKSRIADLERRLVTSPGDRRECIQTPRSEAGGLVPSYERAPSHLSYQSPVASTGPLSSHESQGLSSPHIAEGPLKALNSFRAEHLFESERNDPVAGSIITEGEAYVMFRLYFANCHPNAPFLDKEHDNNIDRIRSSSALLFLSILSVGARFWGASSNLALSARRPSSLKPEPLHDVLENFTRCKYTQSSDIRLASLFRVAYTANFSGCRPTTIESVEAFDRDVDSIERSFLQSLNSPPADGFNQHFPPQRMGKVLTWAIEWSSNILIHLAGRNLSKEVNINSIPTRLEPDPSVVQMMSFAIDHYHVVIAYAAFILVKSWLSNLTDMDLRPHLQYSGENLNRQASHSLLFRLVDLAARTLDAASPPIGHLARRYVPLLNGMAGLVSAGNRQNAQFHAGGSDAGVAIAEANPVHTGQAQNALGDDLWEMWQEAGLEPMVWPSLLDEIFGEL
ncbi:hypothetical protein MYU51_008045 [Penicillium brevicompactum]